MGDTFWLLLLCCAVDVSAVFRARGLSERRKARLRPLEHGTNSSWMQPVVEPELVGDVTSQFVYEDHADLLPVLDKSNHAKKDRPSLDEGDRTVPSWSPMISSPTQAVTCEETEMDSALASFNTALAQLDSTLLLLQASDAERVIPPPRTNEASASNPGNENTDTAGGAQHIASANRCLLHELAASLNMKTRIVRSKILEKKLAAAIAVRAQEFEDVGQQLLDPPAQQKAKVMALSPGEVAHTVQVVVEDSDSPGHDGCNGNETLLGDALERSKRLVYELQQAKLHHLADTKRFQALALESAEEQQAQFMRQLKSELEMSFHFGKRLGGKVEQEKLMGLLEKKVAKSARDAAAAVRVELGHKIDRLESETAVFRAEKENLAGTADQVATIVDGVAATLQQLAWTVQKQEAARAARQDEALSRLRTASLEAVEGQQAIVTETRRGIIQGFRDMKPAVVDVLRRYAVNSFDEYANRTLAALTLAVGVAKPTLDNHVRQEIVEVLARTRAALDTELANVTSTVGTVMEERLGAFVARANHLVETTKHTMQAAVEHGRQEANASLAFKQGEIDSLAQQVQAIAQELNQSRRKTEGVIHRLKDEERKAIESNTAQMESRLNAVKNTTQHRVSQLVQQVEILKSKEQTAEESLRKANARSERILSTSKTQFANLSNSIKASMTRTVQNAANISAIAGV